MIEKRVLIAAGGTGGHVFPGISIAEELTKRDVKVAIVLSNRAIDREISSNIPFETIVFNSESVVDKSGIKLPLTLFGLLGSIYKAYRLIRKFKPNAVIGIGGFIGGPIVIAATLNLIPTIIVEPNAVAGRANRLLGFFADKICVGFEETKKYFSKRKVVFSGNPIRQGLSANEHLGDKLLIIGGSQGAKNLNQLVVDSLPYLLSQNIKPEVIHQTGNYGMNEIRKAYENAGINAEVFSFINDMQTVYKQTKIAISRAGAGAVSELSVAGIPSIFIPFPYATDDHQFANAKVASKTGGSYVFREQELDAKKLADLIAKFWNDKDVLIKMSKEMKKISKPDASEYIAMVCWKMMEGK